MGREEIAMIASIAKNRRNLENLTADER